MDPNEPESKRLKSDGEAEARGAAPSEAASGQVVSAGTESAAPAGSSEAPQNGSAATGTAEDKPKKKKAPKPAAKDKQEAGKSDKDKEFEVPLTAMNKILRAALPEGSLCSKDAKSAFSKAAGIFVLYITACANDMAKGNKRQTISGQDITNALSELGYASFLPHLDATMEKMKNEAAQRKIQKEASKKKLENSATAAAASSGAAPSINATEPNTSEHALSEEPTGGLDHDATSSLGMMDAPVGGDGLDTDGILGGSAD